MQTTVVQDSAYTNLARVLLCNYNDTHAPYDTAHKKTRTRLHELTKTRAVLEFVYYASSAPRTKKGIKTRAVLKLA